MAPVISFLWTVVVKRGWELGMVVYAYNPSKGEAGQEDHKFELSLGSLAKLCLKK